MWKAVIADDEEIIVRGLKKLIDWEKLEIEIVGETFDGDTLKFLIEEVDPDLVISDIKMPGMTGLEVLAYFQERGPKPKFIFISGFEDFSYVQTALRGGAVDYLLKPVRRKDLQESVQKALNQIRESRVVEVFDEEQSELEKLMDSLNSGDREGQEDLSQIELDFDRHLYVGVTIGLCPDEAARLRDESFERFNLLRFSGYNLISGMIRQEDLGFVLRREEKHIHLLAKFDRDMHKDEAAKCFYTMQQQLSERLHVDFCTGVGMPARSAGQLRNSLKTSRYAFDLYAFLEEPVVLFEDIHQEFNVSEDDFKEAEEQIFRLLAAHSGEYKKEVEHLIRITRVLHFGNLYGAKHRFLVLTGNINSRLYKFNMLDGEFNRTQDELQHQIEQIFTYRELGDCIRAHFDMLYERICAFGRSKDSETIDAVKSYIREHYMEEISMKTLSEIACVSVNYFSAMFKRETGENYKAYLTKVRMEAALKLLQETDCKTYEIGEQVGYNNVRRFVDAFKSIYGVSPLEYKKRLKE